MIENVQIRATSLVDGIGDLCYEDRLKKLNLPSLKYRRKRGDMIEMFKHFNKYDKHALSSSFQPRPRVLRKHKLQVYERIPSDGCRGMRSIIIELCPSSYALRVTPFSSYAPLVTSSRKGVTRRKLFSYLHRVMPLWHNSNKLSKLFPSSYAPGHNSNKFRKLFSSSYAPGA